MISTQYQLPSIALELAGLSLTLNLALSGAFIYGSSGKSVPAYRETSLRLTKKRCVGD